MIYSQIFADNFHVQYSHKLVLGYMENLLIFVFYGLFLWMKVYWYPVYFHVIILYISIEDFLMEGNCKTFPSFGLCFCPLLLDLCFLPNSIFIEIAGNSIMTD